MDEQALKRWKFGYDFDLWMANDWKDYRRARQGVLYSTKDMIYPIAVEFMVSARVLPAQSTCRTPDLPLAFLRVTGSNDVVLCKIYASKSARS